MKGKKREEKEKKEKEWRRKNESKKRRGRKENKGNKEWRRNRKERKRRGEEGMKWKKRRCEEKIKKGGVNKKIKETIGVVRKKRKKRKRKGEEKKEMKEKGKVKTKRNARKKIKKRKRKKNGCRKVKSPNLASEGENRKERHSLHQNSGSKTVSRAGKRDCTSLLCPDGNEALHSCQLSIPTSSFVNALLRYPFTRPSIRRLAVSTRLVFSFVSSLFQTPLRSLPNENVPPPAKLFHIPTTNTPITALLHSLPISDSSSVIFGPYNQPPTHTPHPNTRPQQPLSHQPKLRFHISVFLSRLFSLFFRSNSCSDPVSVRPRQAQSFIIVKPLSLVSCSPPIKKNKVQGGNSWSSYVSLFHGFLGPCLGSSEEELSWIISVTVGIKCLRWDKRRRRMAWEVIVAEMLVKKGGAELLRPAGENRERWIGRGWYCGDVEVHHKLDIPRQSDGDVSCKYRKCRSVRP